MLARIPELNCFRFVRIALLFCVATALASCAKDPPQLIADPGNTRETALPWNQQEKWEREGAAGQGLNTAHH